MRLLLAVDAAHDPAPALALAVPFAARVGGVIGALYAHVPVDIPHWIEAIAGDAVRAGAETTRLERQAALDAALGELPAHLRGTAASPVGYPARLVPEAAVGYEVLIVTTHGRTGLARLWSGSIAEELVAAATGDVLVLHANTPPPTPIPPPGAPMRVLLVATPAGTRGAMWVDRLDAAVQVLVPTTDPSAETLAIAAGFSLVIFGDPYLAAVDAVLRASPTPVLVLH